MKILLKIAYLGTAYRGYQVQANGVTVQGKLNEAAKALFGVDCDIVGCSRTDSGVHARAFMATVAEKGKNMLVTSVPALQVPRAMNAFLPPDIAVLEARAVDDGFHARYDVKWKEYEYLILNDAVRDPFFADRAWHVPQTLDLAAMQTAAALFVGKKDFSAVRDASEDKKEDAVRTVFAANVTRDGQFVRFRVRADGFLYHMVRVMTGTLAAVGKGSLSPKTVEKGIAARDRTALGATAPACGLYLDTVCYQ